MVIEHFANLPPYLHVEGVDFELQLIVDGRPDDVRLVYALQYSDEDSTHYDNVKSYGSWENPFQNGHLQGFLFLRQGISNDEEFIEACAACKMFLICNNLLNK